MKRRYVIAAGIVAIAVVAGVFAAILTSSPKPLGGGNAAAPRITTTTTSTGQSATDPSTIVATLHSTIPKYSGPHGHQTGTVPGTWFGAASALPVIAQADGYLDVRLAQRPNESTGWIRATDVTLSSTPYLIEVDLATKRLELYESGHLLMTAPAGIGTAQAPTPTGDFFVALYANPPSSAWGPFIMVTSGHSDAISDWEQSGDAIVAIHGPLGADAEIGTNGAAVSHGCVRLHNVDLEQLRVVPVGTPVQIID